MNIDPAQWVTASASGGNGQCVQLRQHEDAVEVRDTKNHGTGPTLALTPAVFTAWITAAKNGQFDNLSR